MLSMTRVSLSQVFIPIVSYPYPLLASNEHLCHCYLGFYRGRMLLQNRAPVAATISGKQESTVRSRTSLCQRPAFITNAWQAQLQERKNVSRHAQALLMPEG